MTNIRERGDRMYEQLKEDAAKGVGWAFLSSTSVRVLQVITTLTLAKLLMPADFGVFALATLIINAVTIFRDIGLAQFLIYQRENVPKAANTAFILSLISSVFVGGLLYVSATVLGKVFSTPTIVNPVRVMSIALALSAAANVHFALLDKQLKFRLRAIPEMAGAFAYAVISIVLAVIGYRAWSLVIGWVVMQIVSTIVVWFVSGWRPKIEFSLDDARVIVAYGKHLVVASLAAFAFFQIDNASIGKWLGVTALGFYSMAFTVCNMPATNLSHVVNRVMFPTYSKLRDDLPEMGRVYIRTVRYISMCAFPAAIAIFILSGPIIRVFYGEKWVPAIPLFKVLAFYGLMRSVGCTPSAVFMSTGAPGLVRRVSLLQLIIAVPLVYPVARAYGALGVAVLFTIAYMVGMLYSLSKVQSVLSLGVRSYTEAMGLPLGATAIAGVVCWVVSRGIGLSWMSIAASGVIFSSLYLMSVHLLDRDAYKEIMRLFRKPKRSTEIV